MKIIGYANVLLIFVLYSNNIIAQNITVKDLKPDTISFVSGNLLLKGLMWMPPGGGRHPAILFNHGSELKALKYLSRIAPAFVDQGYAFFVPFRRGQGLSQGQGKYILAELDSAEKAGGITLRTSLMIKLHETTQLEDQLAALSFLKMQNGIDSGKILVAGVSFGGIQSLLIATQSVSIKGVVDFAGAAMNWEKGPEVPMWLKGRMKDIKVPVYFIQAENDFSIKPSLELSQELKRLGKPYEIKIYPPYGSEPMDGHAFIDQFNFWGKDVFPRLKEWVNKK
jgi:carboxymethylenebutenolidase